MAGYALLIGTKDGKRELVIDGDPRDIRKEFKTNDGMGFDKLEVVETASGRTRSRRFVKTAKKAAKKASSKVSD